MKNTNATVAATLPWIEQVKASLAPNELGGVATGLAEATPSLAKLQAEQVPFYQQTELFNKCMTNVIYPAGNTKLQDGSATSGVEDYKEFWYGLVGLSGIGQGFDGNGPRAKFLVGNSGQTLRSRPDAGSSAAASRGCGCSARSPLQPLGTRPAFPAEEPPYQPLVPCYKQTVPNFNGPLSAGPADGSEVMSARRPTGHEGGLSVRDQIERYRSSFIAVVTMVLIAAFVGGYILAHENLNLPAWVPVLGHNYYKLDADFQTAQAVTPGQGQAVTIAGAKIGEVAAVDLHEGVARVTMNLDPKYADDGSSATRRCCCARRRSCRTSPSRSTPARARPASCTAAK